MLMPIVFWPRILVVFLLLLFVYKSLFVVEVFLLSFCSIFLWFSLLAKGNLRMRIGNFSFDLLGSLGQKYYK